MDVATIANVATALIVLTGVRFGLVEARQARKDREERAAFAALDAILTPEWMKSIVIVHAIPEGTSAAEIEADAEEGDIAASLDPAASPSLAEAWAAAADTRDSKFEQFVRTLAEVIENGTARDAPRDSFRQQLGS